MRIVIGVRLDTVISDPELVAWSGMCHGFGVSDLITTADQAMKLSQQKKGMVMRGCCYNSLTC